MYVFELAKDGHGTDQLKAYSVERAYIIMLPLLWAAVSFESSCSTEPGRAHPRAPLIALVTRSRIVELPRSAATRCVRDGWDWVSCNHGRGGPGGWWILPEVDGEIEPGEVVRPDVSGWRRQRLPHPGGVRPIRVVPDWVCEVTSPTSGGRDRVYKRALYARTGVAHYWLINPAERVLEALALRDGQWLEIGAYGDGDLARIAPFSEVELDVGQLFLPPPTTEGCPPRWWLTHRTSRGIGCTPIQPFVSGCHNSKRFGCRLA